MQMATPEGKPARRPRRNVPWLPIWSLVLGIAIFAAMAAGGNIGRGLVSLGLFAAFAAVFFLGSGNETIAGLATPRSDERWAMINQRSLAFAGVVLVLILVAGWIVELANGHDGSPYTEVMGGGAVAYFAAALWLRFRS